MNITLGKTGLIVCKDGFGALPIQRADMETAVKIILGACEGGINYFDTARMYTDSEEKLGLAFFVRGSVPRDKLAIATKTAAQNTKDFWKDLEESLRLLKTDYIDVYQFHNPPQVFKPEDGTGLYEAMLAAKKQGKIRFIGITNHKITLAREAVETGLYDTLQYPFSYLSDSDEMALVGLCEKTNTGFIAMKALSGGLITDINCARVWIHHFPNVLPIWGIQRGNELEELLKSVKAMPDSFLAAPSFNAAQKKRIEKDREELSGEFCRGCGYCMPCPEGIIINNCARMSLMLRRAPEESWLSQFWQAEMAKIENCRHCDSCASQCPYGLDTPALLKKCLEDYKTFLQ